MANKLYEEQSVKDIAEAIRLKRNGSTDTYAISDMNDGVLCLPTGNIPKYHYEEAGRVVNALLELKKAHPNSIVFGTISDNHVDLSNDAVKRSARHAVYALESVGSMACDFVANLGDNVAGTNIDNDTDYANAVYMENASRYAMTGLAAYNLVGNHCKSNSTQKIYDLIGKYNSFDNYGTTRIRGFGYKDYADKKVRVICLNTCDYWNGQGGNGMSYEQKDFFMKALDLSAKSGYADWTILVLSHIPLDFLGGDYNKGADLKAILKAYNAGSSVSISVNSSYASAQNESGKYSGTLTYSYAGKNAPRLINIHGHVHTNTYGKLTFIDDNTVLNFYRVATPNSSFNGNASTDRYTAYGNYSITAAEAAKIKKVANTKADTSATFYLIDLDSEVIYAVGYGADINRTVIYNDKTRYSVTYSLTACSVSNDAEETYEGASYITFITPTIADGGIQSVNVTMGGVDITSSCYLNGFVSIPSVTGDIVITAVAAIPLWTEKVSDLAVAPRSVWAISSAGEGLSLVTSNGEASIGVSTPNDYGFTDRESNPIYVMPVSDKASIVTITNTDGYPCTFRFIGLKDNGGTVSVIFDSKKISENTYTFAAGSITHILLSMERTDGSSFAWGYSDNFISVEFSNGGTSTGGGGNTPAYTNVIDTAGTEDSVRLRSGGNTAEANGFASGFFPVKAGDVIRVYFPNGSRESIPSNGQYCILYADDKATVNYGWGADGNVIQNKTSTGYEVHIPADYTCSYARVAGGPEGAYADWVVTVNEPIE